MWRILEPLDQQLISKSGPQVVLKLDHQYKHHSDFGGTNLIEETIGKHPIGRTLEESNRDVADSLDILFSHE